MNPVVGPPFSPRIPMELFQNPGIPGRPQADDRNIFMSPLDAQLHRGQRFTRPPQWNNPVKNFNGQGWYRGPTTSAVASRSSSINFSEQPDANLQVPPNMFKQEAPMFQRPMNVPPPSFPTPPPSTPSAASAQVDKEKIYVWINELTHPDTRENALIELSRKRECPDLALMLWHSFGTISALLQEVIGIYPYINPPTLTAHQSNRVCNALALLQCVASHAETRTVFLGANIPLFLYPFLHTVCNTRPFEYLRLTSLGVIGALVKADEQEVITFLLSTEIIPLCLRIMELGSELSKTVATFILQKILLDDTGLNYICQTYERFSHVAMILGRMILALASDQSARLLKHVIRCYLRLSDNPRAREALRQCLPDQLKDGTFLNCLKDDTSTKNWLSQLLKNLESGPGPEEHFGYRMQ